MRAVAFAVLAAIGLLRSSHESVRSSEGGTPSAVQQAGHPVFDAPGFQDDRSYHSPLPFEFIDPMTGSLVLRFADFHLPGNNGLDLVIERIYNSKGGPGNGGWWTIAPGGFPLSVAPFHPTSLEDQGYALRMPDGATKRTSAPAESNRYYYTDQFWRYDRQTHNLELPNGLVAEYGTLWFSPDPYARYLSRVSDAFGNELIYSWVLPNGKVEPAVITQNLAGSPVQSRQVTFNWSGTTGLLDSVSFNGRAWTYEYSTAENGSRWLSRAIPPIGPSWQFSYVNAELRMVTLPSGGEVNYQWVWHPFPGDAESDGQSVYTIALKRRTNSGRNVPQPAPWEFTYPTQAGGSTSLLTPCREILERSGAGGLAERKVMDDEGLHEHELRTYKRISVGNLGHYALEQRTIARDGQTHTTSLAYSPNNFGDYGKPSSISEQNGASTRFTGFQYKHDFSRYIRGRVTSESVSISGETANETFTRAADYNSQTGFMERFTQYGVQTFYGAHASGNVGTVTDAHSHQTHFGYQWGQVSSIQTPSYAITRAINPDGSLASETRRGFTTNYQYDSGGREILRTAPGANSTSTSYDDVDGQAIHTTRGNNTHHQYLDGFGRPYVTDDAAGNRVHVFYDGCGRKDFESYPYASTAPMVGTTYTFDALGRVKQKLNADNTRVNYSYANGTTTIQDENGRQTRQTWLSYGDPDDARLVGVVDAANHSTSYLYNAVGSLLRVSQPQGITRTFEYNASNQLISETHPESGEVEFAYDAAGLLSSRTDFRGATTFFYDANHRVERVDKPGTYHDVEMTYDDSDNRRLLRNSFVRSEFDYDSGNRLIKRVDHIASRSFITQLDYDGNDNVRWLKYPSGREVTQSFDHADRLTAVLLGSVPVATGFVYHPSGAVSQYTAGNGIVHTTTFDGRYRPARLASQHLDVTYGYDNVGNVTAVTDTRPGFSQSLVYDPLDRLTHVNGFGQNVFEYDAVGNRTTKQAPSVTYYYDGSNRLASTSGHENAAFEYDVAGNTTNDGAMSFGYTPDNMMETATGSGGQTTYWYDGDNVRKYRRLADNTAFFYLNAGGLNTLSEFKLQGDVLTLERDYIYAGTRLLASTSTPSDGGPGGPPPPGSPPVFTDDPIVAGVTVVKAVHVTELRTAIDGQRVRFGLSPYSWLHSPLVAQSHQISFAHIAQMRDALIQTYQAAGRTPPTFIDPALQVGVTPVKAIHMSQLRAALLALFQ